jgi:hypothetical protein
MYIEYRRNYTQKLLHCDLSLSSRSSKIHLQLIRIDSLGSMQCAREIFGNTFGIGIRNRAPKKGEPPRSMHYGDIVNYVDVLMNYAMADALRQQEFTFAQGIDFIFNDDKRTLKIRVRYSRVEAQANVVATTLRLMQPVENHNVRNARISHVAPGTMFIRLGELVQVVSVNGNNVVIIDDNAEHSTIELNEAIQLLEDYIG